MQVVLSLGLVKIGMGAVSHAVGVQNTPDAAKKSLAYQMYLDKVAK